MKTNVTALAAPVAQPATPLPGPPGSVGTGTGTNAVGDALRDIVGPVSIVNWREWILPGVLAAAILTLAVWLGRRWWRSRQLRLRQGPPPAPPLPPHERARRRLDDAFRFLGEPDRFCTEVSGVLREYVEERFGWNAPDRTTEEFLLQLRGRPELDAAHQDLLQDFLTRCDFVKFARYEPTEDELRALHTAAIRFVVDTIPRPPASTAGPANPDPDPAPRT